MDFSRETCLQLIKEYENRPVLWKVTHEQYYNKIKKEDAWREIAPIFDRDVNEIQKKIQSLKGSYRREKAKVKKSVGTGKGTDEIYISKWFAYNSLQFLDERDTPRTTVDSLRTDNNEDDSSSTEENGEAIQNTDASVVVEENELQPEMTPAKATITEPRPQKPKIFKSPKRLKIAKRRGTETDSRVALAFDYLQTAAAAESSTPKEAKDDCTTFGDHIAAKIRKLDPQLRAIAQHRISSVIFELEMMQYTNRSAGATSFTPTSQFTHHSVTQPTPSSQFHSHLSSSLTEPFQSSQHTSTQPASYSNFSAHSATEISQSPRPMRAMCTVSQTSASQSPRYDSDTSLASYFHNYDSGDDYSK